MSVRIEILGMGCSKCRILFDNTERAVRLNGIDAEVVKVDDMEVIAGYGVMMLPALVVNGVVKIAGRLPSADEIGKLIGDEYR